jgi:hypothetical protein
VAPRRAAARSRLHPRGSTPNGRPARAGSRQGGRTLLPVVPGGGRSRLAPLVQCRQRHRACFYWPLGGWKMARGCRTRGSPGRPIQSSPVVLTGEGVASRRQAQRNTATGNTCSRLGSDLGRPLRSSAALGRLSPRSRSVKVFRRSCPCCRTVPRPRTRPNVARVI